MILDVDRVANGDSVVTVAMVVDTDGVVIGEIAFDTETMGEVELVNIIEGESDDDSLGDAVSVGSNKEFLSKRLTAFDPEDATVA